MKNFLNEMENQAKRFESIVNQQKEILLEAKKNATPEFLAHINEMEKLAFARKIDEVTKYLKNLAKI